MTRNGTGAGSPLTRREMIVRLIGGAGAGMICVETGAAQSIHKHMVHGGPLAHADEQVAAAPWTPAVLDAHQNETLIVLAERIVPNSTKAQVNRTIDLLLSVDSAEDRQRFVDALSAIDHESQQRFGQPFKNISDAQQTELLTIASAKPPGNRNRVPFSSRSDRSREERRTANSTLYDHFDVLKHWTTRVYYSSEVGMRELGWTGEYFFDSYPGCQHPEGHS